MDETASLCSEINPIRSSYEIVQEHDSPAKRLVKLSLKNKRAKRDGIAVFTVSAILPLK
ncbi:hypothetical protein KIN20_022781 [Parelaphostrongylus tenuis]|uniref:Uncharacterized protein n=1 Tax=Parelaphostrongylus tenuis TaxID=148309 RepID=A0AAD5N8C4_PARTN|nr:hypothetical protein KIN20_022781 [Parelaphostrongylus tenuis]